MFFKPSQKKLNAKLRKAIDADDLGLVMELIDMGADMNVRPGDEYMPPVYRAAQQKKLAILSYLLMKGANPDVRWNDRYTALDRAISQNNRLMAEMLLAAKADVNMDIDGGKGPLYLAVDQERTTLVKMLLAAGAKVDMRDKNGNTPLHVAAQKGYAEIATLLIEAGADRGALNNSMNAPGDIAERNYPRLAALLRTGQMPAAEEPKPIPEPAPTPVETPVPITIPVPAQAEWRKLAEDEVARIVEKQGIGYKLTEVFNFSSKLYTQIAQNMKTGQESQTVKHFDDLGDTSLIGVAQNVLSSLGGHVPEPKLNKPVLPQPGAAS